jgi:hypothetical protein
MKPARIHVWPWLRRPGGRLVPNWLAITLGRHVFAWRQMDERETAHELAHVRQWQRFGWRFPIAYVAASMAARRAGGHWYRDNRYELEAREVAKGGGPTVA